MDYKIKYVFRSAFHYFEDRYCPNCGEKNVKLVQRKYLVTLLLKCDTCGLMHRHPKDSKAFLDDFYQEEYTIEQDLMTEMPSDAAIAEMMATNFPTQRDYSKYFKALNSKQENLIKIVDYGCSWGYDVYKFNQQGFDAVGYELSKQRAHFGNNKLQVNIVANESEVRENNDFIFSSHVIEHVYSVPDFIKYSKTKLKTDGIFIAFCPNGNMEYAEREPVTFSANWGSVHPFYLDFDFISKIFSNNPYLILTGDWEFDPDEIKAWDGKSQKLGSNRDGKELLIIAKPNINLSDTKH